MRRRREDRVEYDRERKEPAIRASICTGERVAGFLDRESRRFEEVMLLRGEEDLEAFRRRYGIAGEIRTIY